MGLWAIPKSNTIINRTLNISNTFLVMINKNNIE